MHTPPIIELSAASIAGLESLHAIPPLAPYAPVSLDFVQALSQALLKHVKARAYPELMALGYWLRQAQMARLQKEFRASSLQRLWTARGTVLHIPPANVDSIFIYSWLFSLLAGNRNIIRLSTRSSPQLEVLLELILGLLRSPQHCAIAERTRLVSYTANDQITTDLSAMCDMRVVWGGDATIAAIRALPLPPTASEIAFADKYSMALIDAQKWLAYPCSQRRELALHFWNDSYWFGQMACSSPRLVLWVGSLALAKQASDDFWPYIDAISSQRQIRFEPINYVDKLVAVQNIAIDAPNATVYRGSDNALTRIWLEQPCLYAQYHCGGGLFLEAAIPDIDTLATFVSRKVQTVSYAGFSADDCKAFVRQQPLSGIDRFVPFGQALDFAPIWDGMDLRTVFLREITVC